ncbi:hypothetical protein [uncultured Sneathia sp.]|uniref:hypothetical protein n=1 Tax=uncultured Sneathia sp. TaxID=278067 RepID=UPI0025997691|nr:hypothetical protein [uncultured Sneathia sp.]
MSQGVDPASCLPKTAWPPTLSKVNNQEVVEEIKSTNVEEKISSENDNIEELD